MELEKMLEHIEKNRVDQINYYLDIAETVLKRSTCLKRNYGAVIVKNNEIISTGYNGSPRGITNCSDIKKCSRENCPRGTGYENCISVHAEMNAIISSTRRDMIDSSLFLVGIEPNGNYVNSPEPCSMCKRIILNAGIKYVYIRINKSQYKLIYTSTWKKENLIGGY
jgi:dCMP deaminase